jgi:hypothetical protein
MCRMGLASSSFSCSSTGEVAGGASPSLAKMPALIPPRPLSGGVRIVSGHGFSRKKRVQKPGLLARYDRHNVNFVSVL